MMQIRVWLEGMTPMLQHRATEESLRGETRTNTPREADDPRTVAGRAVYRVGDQLAVPGTAFARMVREAGGNYKAKGSRKSLKYIVPAAMLVLDELCPIWLRDRKTQLVDFEVDSRPVTIPATRGRVMRHRARFNEWAVPVTVRLNEDILAESMLRQLFADGAQQIGIGDFRPACGGPYGTASIVAWDIVSDRKSPNEAQKRNGRASAEARE